MILVESFHLQKFNTDKDFCPKITNYTLQSLACTTYGPQAKCGAQRLLICPAKPFLSLKHALICKNIPVLALKHAKKIGLAKRTKLCTSVLSPISGY